MSSDHSPPSPSHVVASTTRESISEKTVIEKESSSNDVSSDPEALARVSSGPAYSVFAKGTRRFIVTMIAIGGVVSPMTANIYFPALNPIATDLGVSIGLINLTLTTYMIFQSIAPPIFGDFGDMAGRRPAFIISFSIYVVANLGLALQRDYAALLVLRMLQSAGSSGTLALCFAVIADVSVSAERGKYMGILGAGINVGPSLSPVLGGILAECLGWQAIFWFCLIFSGAWLIPFVLAVPETGRNVVGNGSIPPTGWNMTLIDYLRSRRPPPQRDTHQAVSKPPLRFPNPFNALKAVLQKDLAMLYLYGTLVYLVFILICATLSTEFKAIYGYNDLIIGLCYLPYGLGCCSAAVFQSYALDWNYRRIARSIGLTIDYRRGDDMSKFPIEKARLQPAIPVLVVGIATTICYGWVLQAKTHVAVPLVLLYVIGLCVTGSFSILHSMVVDLYPEAPATAIAANNLVRCLFGAGGTAVIEPMLKSMGRGWTYTFWALVLVVFSPMLYVLARIGPRCREERRLKRMGDESSSESSQSVEE
ncbi:major facilitator superfamily domain-containing protein [Podospora aff. communis PSN243]|uniref:Major facilitator superfamily domain-containing protein n=1 Tax=Podospora aff. communis PSN243 TaxID=3040156 RepID=A0AAV9GB12_9PEZI|nr:major facilitator superfamily domain-containing protein [Podospora aff. communis PSN243]